MIETVCGGNISTNGDNSRVQHAKHTASKRKRIKIEINLLNLMSDSLRLCLYIRAVTATLEPSSDVDDVVHMILSLALIYSVDCSFRLLRHIAHADACA